ncbi:hypothetical protein AS149_13005 [Burkholderia cenocepacia]|nr:hypothetical protein AS149_13005 [Burkholderia cenocepacia]
MEFHFRRPYPTAGGLGVRRRFAAQEVCNAHGIGETGHLAPRNRGVASFNAGDRLATDIAGRRSFVLRQAIANPCGTKQFADANETFAERFRNARLLVHFHVVLGCVWSDRV